MRGAYMQQTIFESFYSLSSITQQVKWFIYQA